MGQPPSLLLCIRLVSFSLFICQESFACIELKIFEHRKEIFESNCKRTSTKDYIFSNLEKDFTFRHQCVTLIKVSLIHKKGRARENRNLTLHECNLEAATVSDFNDPHRKLLH